MIIQLPELTAFQDIPGYKAILKAVIKSQIQFLVQQLSQQTGEESVLLTASISDGTLSHLGSETGKVFLEKNDDFKSQFLGFCIKRHHSTLSRAAVRKKPPTAKRSVPFGYNNNPKRQHTEPLPVPGTLIETPPVNNENNQTDIPDIASNLPTHPNVETDNVEESVQEGTTEKNNAGDNDDAASDKTIENYPIVKQEPVDDSDNAETSYDTSFQDLDTSITNGGEMIVKHKKGKKLKLPSDDQTLSFEGEPNASAVKIEYPGSEFMTDETGSSADTSLNMQDESGSFDYGQGSGSLTEHQLFFSQAEPTPKNSSMVYSNVGLPAVRRLRQYSKESMAAAIEAVRSGRMRKSQAAQFYGVPRTTLLDKLSGRTPEEYHSPCFRRVYNYMRTPSSRDAKGSTDQDQKKLETSMQEQTNSPIKPESSVQEQSNIASQDAKVNPGKDQIKCEDFMQEQMNSGDSD